MNSSVPKAGLNLGEIPENVLVDLRKRGNTDQDIAAMTPDAAFVEYCKWNGLSDWGRSLIAALDGLRNADVARVADKVASADTNVQRLEAENALMREALFGNDDIGRIAAGGHMQGVRLSLEQMALLEKINDAAREGRDYFISRAELGTAYECRKRGVITVGAQGDEISAKLTAAGLGQVIEANSAETAAVATQTNQEPLSWADFMDAPMFGEEHPDFASSVELRNKLEQWLTLDRKGLVAELQKGHLAAQANSVELPKFPEGMPFQVPVTTYKAPDGVTDWPAYSFEQRQEYALAAVKLGAVKLSNAAEAGQFTVIGHDEYTSMLFVENVKASDIMNAFAVAAQERPDAYFSVAIPGTLSEDNKQLALAGEGLVCTASILEQEDVYGVAAGRENDEEPDGP